METFWECYFPPYIIGAAIALIVGIVIYSFNYDEAWPTAPKWKKRGARLIISFPIWPLALIAAVFAFIPKIIKDAT